MATNYRLLLDAQIDPNTLSAQIKTLSDKNSILLNVKFNQTDIATLNDELNKIKASGNQLLSVTTIGDELGQINSASIKYLDTNKNIVTQMLEINSAAGQTVKTTENMAAQAKEFSNALLNADKFLATAKNMSQTPNVQAATATAQGIKVAVEEGDIAKVRELNDQLAIQKASLQAGRTGLDSWATGMKNAIKQTVEYSLSIGLVYGALNQFKEGIQYIKDLNKEMVNIQLVTGQDSASTAKLANDYNDLAKSMSVSTLEIARGSLEFIRQGKTAEETGVLIKNSTMLSKLGNMDAAASSEALTAVMNGFKMQAQDTGEVVSKLVAIDNVAATSVQELATAMQYGSATAQQVGIDFNHLAAYIGTVSSTTRLSAETIGQAIALWVGGVVV